MTIEIQQQKSLMDFNTLRLKVVAQRFVSVRTESQLRDALALARDNDWPVMILGGGSNVVLGGDIAGLVIHMAITTVEFDGIRVDAGAGCVWHDLVAATIAQGLSGLENLSLIPGSVGAAPIQNIGAYGVELKDILECVIALDRRSGALVQLNNADCEFDYRHSVFKSRLRDQMVIMRVRLKLSKVFRPRLGYRELAQAVDAEVVRGTRITAQIMSDIVCRIRRSKLPDPDVIGNVGSFFKNPHVSLPVFEQLQSEFAALPAWPDGGSMKLSAGWLIEQCGLKGFRQGGAAVSLTHALIITNVDSASGEDVLTLARLIVEKVQHRFNLTLEVEPIVYAPTR